MAKKVILAVIIGGSMFATQVNYAGGGYEKNRYALEAFVGKADQQNSAVGLPTLSGYETSQGIQASVFVSRSLAFQLGYDDYGRGSESFIDGLGYTITNTLDTNAYKIGFQAGWEINRLMQLTGRAGIALWELEFTEADSAFPGQLYVDDDEGVDAYYGVGLQFDVEKNFRLSLDYNILEFGPTIGAANTDHRVENLSLSAGFVF